MPKNALSALKYAPLMAVASIAAAPANAAANIASGSFGDLHWEAASRLVAMTPTMNTPSGGALPNQTGGGNPTFQPDYSVHAGVAALIMEYSDGSRFICSGSLASDRASIITAGHCVSSGGGVVDANLVSTTAYFYDGASGELRVPFNEASTAITVSDYFVNSLYTGDVIDQNDIAVLRLSELAPAFAQSYELYSTADLTGEQFNVAGYGNRSDVGGGGPTGGLLAGSTGWLREGDNIYDFRLGDSRFGTAWASILGEPYSQIEYSYLSDFDNGLAVNDTACRITQASNFGGLPGTSFCNLGLGEREVGIAGGDSGGPGFIDGRLASVNSYGLTFGTAWGDCRTGLQSSCGEFSGYVPIFLHESWLNSVLLSAIPEPASWAMMIAGFGAVGGVMRRRPSGGSTAVAA